MSSFGRGPTTYAATPGSAGHLAVAPKPRSMPTGRRSSNIFTSRRENPARDAAEPAWLRDQIQLRRFQPLPRHPRRPELQPQRSGGREILKTIGRSDSAVSDKGPGLPPGALCLRAETDSRSARPVRTGSVRPSADLGAERPSHHGIRLDHANQAGRRVIRGRCPYSRWKGADTPLVKRHLIMRPWLFEMTRSKSPVRIRSAIRR